MLFRDLSRQARLHYLGHEVGGHCRVAALSASQLVPGR
jgi:hypothetical protein